MRLSPEGQIQLRSLKAQCREYYMSNEFSIREEDIIILVKDLIQILLDENEA